MVAGRNGSEEWGPNVVVVRVAVFSGMPRYCEFFRARFDLRRA